MATQAAMNLIEVVVPDLGDVKDAPVIEVLVHAGDQLAVDQTIAVLETEKATMDVPSTVAGIIREVMIKVGDKIGCGSLLVMVEQPAVDLRSVETAVAAPSPTLKPAATPALVVQVRTVVSESAPVEASLLELGKLPHASPSVRRFAREYGVNLTKVRGSGPKERIMHSDLQEFVKSALAQPDALPSAINIGAMDLLPWPQVDFAKFGPIEQTGLSKIKKISGANLTRNAILIPHVTNFDEADITELEAFRIALNAEASGKSVKFKNVKLTMLAFLIKASVTALKEHSTFNASLDGEHLILKRYFHIGFAADTPNGLVVPVIRDADAKGLWAIAAEASELAEQARRGKLKPADMQGGCFTVSSLGGIGGTGFTPIINAPEVAILGAARAGMKPVWDGEQFQPRLVLPLSLSWDHRVSDGASAARFLVTLGRLLADFRRVTL